MSRLISHRQTYERYFLLRVVGKIFAGIGLLLSLAGVVLLGFGLYAIINGASATPPQVVNPFQPQVDHRVTFAYGVGGLVFILWSLGCLISGPQFLGMSALVRLAIHVEENTRVTAQSLEKLCSRLEPRVEPEVPQFLS